MSLRDRLLELAPVYALWQAPFQRQKFAPVLADGALQRAKRVLDIGCGPGTNTAQVPASADYLGADINPAYIASARRRHGRAFVQADVTAGLPAGTEPFDVILMNSLLHHLDTPSVERLLAAAAGLLAPGGTVHILDLVRPARPGPAALLARLDRGDFPRPLEEWRALFARAFAVQRFEPYPLGALGVTLWEMVYFKGGATA